MLWANKIEHFSLLASTVPGWKNLPGTVTLALFHIALVTKKKV